MKNSQVSEAWENNQIAKNANSSTDGKNLFSYSLLIGYTNEQGEKVALQYNAASGNFVSATTSNHVSYANRYADKTEKPTTKSNY
jgi:YD repeat-containing protein